MKHLGRRSPDQTVQLCEQIARDVVRDYWQSGNVELMCKTAAQRAIKVMSGGVEAYKRKYEQAMKR